MERFVSILATLRQYFATHTLPGTPLPAGELLDRLEAFLASGDARLLKTIPMTEPVPVGKLVEGLGAPGTCDVYDQRVATILLALQCQEALGWWAESQLAREAAGVDGHGPLRQLLGAAGLDAAGIAEFTLEHVQTYWGAAGPNSAGRFVLGLPPEELLRVLEARAFFHAGENGLLALLVRHAPTPMAKAAVAGVLQKHPHTELCRLLCRLAGRTFEEEIAAAFTQMSPGERVWLAGDLLAISPNRFGPPLLGAAREILADDDYSLEPAVGVLVELLGEKAIPELVAYLRMPTSDEQAIEHRLAALHRLVSKLGGVATPALVAVAEAESATLRLGAIDRMLALQDAALAPVLERALRRGLSADARTVAKHLERAAQFSVQTFAPELAQRLTDKSKLVREAAADALARHDPEAQSRAESLLAQDHRLARASGIRMLATLGTPGARDLLQRQFGRETDEDLRDLILVALKAGGLDVAALIRERAPADLAASKEAASKIDELGIRWIHEEDLPPLTYQDGTPVGRSEVRYLLFRQSRQPECIPDLQAQALYGLIDRRTSGDFGLKILTLFTQAGADKADAWALVVAAVFGDARVISGLSTLVRRWVEEFSLKLGQWGIDALLLNGSDAALAAVEAIAMKYRSSPRRKYKVVAEAAQRALVAAAGRLGISMDELGDRIVPWLGFAPGERRIIDCGTRTLEASLDLDFKLQLRDVATGKRALTIPKTAPAQVQADFKGLAVLAREVAKGQVARLEHLMVRRHCWSAPVWKERFLPHPLLLPFAVRLIWGVYSPRGALTATFRAMPDRSLTTAADERFELPNDGLIGMVHPIELQAEALAAWREHVTDYEIKPPFPQIDRPVARATGPLAEAFSYDALDGMRVATLAIRGRGQKRGWNIAMRGNAMGMQKAFMGVEAFVQVDGLEFFFHADPAAQVTVRTAVFFSPTAGDAGSVQGRPAVVSLPLGEVPPVVFSEAISELQILSGAAG